MPENLSAFAKLPSGLRANDIAADLPGRLEPQCRSELLICPFLYELRRIQAKGDMCILSPWILSRIL